MRKHKRRIQKSRLWRLTRSWPWVYERIINQGVAEICAAEDELWLQTVKQELGL